MRCCRSQSTSETPYIKRSIQDGPDWVSFQQWYITSAVRQESARFHLRTQNKCVAGESCSMCLRPRETAAEADIQANALAIHRRLDKNKAISTCEDCLCSSLSNSVVMWLREPQSVPSLHRPSSAARRLPYVILPWLAFNYKLDIFCHCRWMNDINME